MAVHKVNIDVVDQTSTNPIAVIGEPQPCENYAATAYEVKQLIQIAKYYVYEAGTNNIINSNNYYDYFPEEQSGGGDIDPALQQILQGVNDIKGNIGDVGEIVEEVLVGPPTLIEKSITENGTYNASDDEADGYSSVTVEVANSYSQADNGKVVSNQTLIAQTSYPITVTENDTYDTTNYNSITVNVSGGGGGGGSSSNVVNFYDYDGTIVQSYSAADFANLSAMPANPTHEGLTAQGWNWSLADAKTYVSKYGKLNIGQMYITSDGKTRLYYFIPKDNLTLNLDLALDEDTELDVDWGDGTEHTTWTSNDGDDSKSHEYSDSGRYTVAISVVSGGFSCKSSGDDDYTLKMVEFGSNVTSIRYDAVRCKKALSSITIPNSVTSIGSSAFSYCHGLSSITIPSSVESIGYEVFYECYALSSITIPDSITRIEYNMFEYCRALSSITIPSSVESIDNNAFMYCSALSSITFSDGVTSIGMSVFYECSALSSITIPNSVESIDSSAFSYCHGLSSITISDSVTSIEDGAFYECYALSSITIPSSVESIGYEVFYECYALSSITFESTTPPELNEDLQLPTTCIIRVPQGTLSDYTSASNYPDPSSYTYEEY